MAQVTSRDIRELIELIDRRAAGVQVHISRDPDDVPFVHLINVPPTQRGFGLGQRTLDLIRQTADACEWTLRLHPTGELGSDYGRLPELVDHWAAAAAWALRRHLCR
ncbi:hypothetical protein [Rhodoglobus vestalii]|uniref:hypothetical protein n=1 Tax=Rhodoglobus vestalii TaxID=193384 RepID=UPI00114D8ED7|nr:hypothetical protein [Rhodoglobus vestalii]